MSNKEERFFFVIFKLSIEVFESGEIRPRIDILRDRLSEMFPRKTFEGLCVELGREVSNKEYDDYIREFLGQKEKWIRDNIKPGTYAIEVALNDTNLVEDEQED